MYKVLLEVTMFKAVLRVERAWYTVCSWSKPDAADRAVEKAMTDGFWSARALEVIDCA